MVQSVLQLAKGWTAESSEFQVQIWGKIFPLSTSSRTVLGLCQRFPMALSPAVKRPGHEADHSHPPSAEVKIRWIYTCTQAVKGGRRV
jgi:hypothetical protein